MLINNRYITSLVYLVFTASLFVTYPACAAERQLQNAVYKGDYKGVGIDMTKQLLDLGEGIFLLSAKADNFMGSIKEYERFHWNADGSITPLEYYYKQRVFGISKKRTIAFNWKEHSATARDHKKSEVIALTPGMLGPMTYQLQLQLDLAKQKSVLLKTSRDSDGNINYATTQQINNRVFEYTFVYRTKIRTYGFVIEGVQAFEQNGTRIANALLLQRRDNDEQKSTQIWFDIEDNFILASLQQNEEDETHQLFLKENTYFPPFENTPYAAFCPPAEEN